MDFMKWKTRISEGIGKYKYVWIVLLAGVVLMMIPGKSTNNFQAETKPIDVMTEENSIQEQLEDILRYIEGAGRVKVMLTVAQGERTIYQTDSTYAQSETNTDSRTQTVLITDSNRNENGLIHQKQPPVYRGAIILTDGADYAPVKLAIVEAVSDVTGLGADKISVIKME